MKFYKIPKRYLSLKASYLGLMAVILTNHKDGVLRGCIENFAEAAGMRPTTLRRRLRELEKAGFISVNAHAAGTDISVVDWEVLKLENWRAVSDALTNTRCWGMSVNHKAVLLYLFLTATDSSFSMRRDQAFLALGIKGHELDDILDDIARDKVIACVNGGMSYLIEISKDYIVFGEYWNAQQAQNRRDIGEQMEGIYMNIDQEKNIYNSPGDHVDLLPEDQMLATLLLRKIKHYNPDAITKGREREFTREFAKVRVKGLPMFKAQEVIEFIFKKDSSKKLGYDWRRCITCPRDLWRHWNRMTAGMTAIRDDAEAKAMIEERTPEEIQAETDALFT